MSEELLGLIAGFLVCGTAMGVFMLWQTRKTIRDTYGPLL
jgi:hypothetical protein